MNILDISNNLDLAENGIYYSKSNSEVSYPDDGNDMCLQIESDSFWFRHRNQAIIAAVKKYSPNNLFFDIGGGNGFVAKGLQNENIETILVEPGEQGAFNAIKRGIDNVVCSTFEDAGFTENIAASVGLFDVVEHIEHDKDFLSSIHKTLKPEGFCYITVPAYNALWSNNDVHAGHFRRYTTKSLSKVCQEAGFNVKYITYLFSPLPIPILIRRAFKGKLGLGKNDDKLKTRQNEHKPKKSITGQLLNKIWDWEIKQVKSGNKIFTGSTCFAVLQKSSV